MSQKQDHSDTPAPRGGGDASLRAGFDSRGGGGELLFLVCSLIPAYEPNLLTEGRGKRMDVCCGFLMC